MRKILNITMAVLLLMLFDISCQSTKWIAEPDIKAANPLPENTPVYIYFSSRMAGLKSDQDPRNYDKPISNYVFLAVVLNGKTGVNLMWDYYKGVEYTHSFYAAKNSGGQSVKPFVLDNLLANLAKGYFKKFVPDKKYFWIKPEGQKDVPPEPDHIILGQGRVLWQIWYFNACESTYSEMCVEAKEDLEKKYYPDLASYALAHGSNVAIITDCKPIFERDSDGKIKTETSKTEKVTYYRDGFGGDKWWNETKSLSEAKWKKTETETHESGVTAGYEYDVMFMRFDDLLSVKK